MKSNQSRAFKFCTDWRAYLVALAIAFAPSAWAQNCTYFDAFKDNRDGTVTDPRSGTVWQRCVAGQSWSGTSCTGQGYSLPWLIAMRFAKTDRFLNQTDWRLPTKAEAESITGKYESCENAKPRRAVSTVFGLASKDVGLGELWTSSPNPPDSVAISGSHFAWRANLNEGGVGIMQHHTEFSVRLVRSGNSSATGEFNREISKLDQYKKAYIALERKWAAEERKTANKTSAQRVGHTKSGVFWTFTKDNFAGVFKVECVEGGSGVVTVLLANKDLKFYSSTGFIGAARNTDASGSSVEEAMNLACKGR